MSTAAQILSHDPAQFHRDRLRYLDERLERAHDDAARAQVQELITSEKCRWKLITDTQPQPK